MSKLSQGIRKFRKMIREHLFRFSLLMNKQRPRVYLFGVPYHSNLGDWAQTVCITQWINRYLPDYQIVYTSLDQDWKGRLRFIRKHIRHDDILLMHSGYHLTDLYSERDVYEAAARLFPDRVIRILPQTVFFKNPDNGLKCADVFNSHGNCIILCRDRISYEKASSLFSNCRLHLYPDIVTSLIGVYHSPASKRAGVLFCMRNDQEALYSREQIDRLMGELSHDYAVSKGDTTISTSVKLLKKDPRAILERELAHFGQYEVVVTDRYHGTIFSLVSGTPVIVLSSSDHKLSSGVQWFPESFRDYVFFAESLEAVPSLLRSILSTEQRPPLPPYFRDRYYSEALKDVLELD